MIFVNLDDLTAHAVRSLAQLGLSPSSFATANPMLKNVLFVGNFIKGFRRVFSYSPHQVASRSRPANWQADCNSHEVHGWGARHYCFHFARSFAPSSSRRDIAVADCPQVTHCSKPSFHRLVCSFRSVGMGSISESIARASILREPQ